METQNLTPREFIIWLRGFAEAANNHNLTPAQWDTLRETLKTVELDTKSTYKLLFDSATSSATTKLSDLGVQEIKKNT